jgi:hypothetical protein
MCRWEASVKMNVTEAGCGDVELDSSGSGSESLAGLFE